MNDVDGVLLVRGFSIGRDLLQELVTTDAEAGRESDQPSERRLDQRLGLRRYEIHGRSWLSMGLREGARRTLFARETSVSRFGRRLSEEIRVEEGGRGR